VGVSVGVRVVGCLVGTSGEGVGLGATFDRFDDGMLEDMLRAAEGA
jgi:hypothetical protein